MAHIVEDAVLETTAVTGTGAATLLGAVSGFRAFGSVMTSPSDTTPYAMWAVDGSGNRQTDWETGIGTYSASNTLTRTTVKRSSNSNAAVSFSAGTKYVAIGALATQLLQLNAEGAVPIAELTNEPTTPAAGVMLLYMKEIGGIGVLRTKNPQGLDHNLQIQMAYNGFETCRGGEVSPTVMGGIPAVTQPTTTGSTVAPTASAAMASTNLATSLRHTNYASSATGGTFSYHVSGPLRYWRGNAAGLGGYSFVERFSLSALQSGMRAFVGLCDSVTALTQVDHTTATTPGKIGMAINASTGNWNLIYNVTGSAPTVVALGASFPVNITDVLELGLFCQPNGSGVGYRVRNLSTGAETSGTISSNQPSNTTFLAPHIWLTNNATAAIASLRFYQWTKEADN